MFKCMSAIFSMALFCCVMVQPCFAADSAADYSDAAVLSGCAAPALISAAGVCLTLGAGHQIVKIVDAAGNGLSELTVDGFNIATAALDALDRASFDSDARVTVRKKDIPLVVRKDYLELNEKVKTP